MNKPVVGVIGGGQLARMMAPAAEALGIHLRVLATSPEESAAQVIPDVVIGAHDDEEAIWELAQGADVVTFDHEHVPQDILHRLRERGVIFHPAPEALEHAQDKIVMRKVLSASGIPTPRWSAVRDADDVAIFAERTSWPVVLKVSRGGYDGKGVWHVQTYKQAVEIIDSTTLVPGAEWLVEEHVPFIREVSAQVARSPHGQSVAYPIVQSRQDDGICLEVIAPVPDMDDDRAAEAQKIALDVAQLLDVSGMLAVELFDTGTEFLVNELAMRPHNTGHWSIEGADTSQFENHLRAVLNYPLGSPAPRMPRAVMVNILGGSHPDLYAAYPHVMARDPGIKIHLYGKDVKARRKVGHVTALGHQTDVLLDRARHAADFFTGNTTVDGE